MNKMEKAKETKLQKSIRKYKEYSRKREDLEEFRRVQNNKNKKRIFKTKQKFDEEKVKGIMVLKNTIKQSKWMIKELKQMKW